MFMLPELVFKLLMYMGSAAVVGGLFTLMLAKGQMSLMVPTRRYILLGAVVTLLAVGGNFYAQVGSFAEEGWGGMFDRTYVAMLWDSSVGNSVAFRAIALGLILCLLLVVGHSVLSAFALNKTLDLLVVGIVGAGSVLLAFSFSLIGHTAELSVFTRLLLSIHVFIALLWMGSLYPLWLACRHVDIPALQSLMHRFGVIAQWLVAVLLVCGGILAYQLLGSVTELITTSYGLLLMAKVALVGVIMGFAGWHKLRLVPGLIGEQAAQRLQRSILLEGLVGAAILVATALLTTVVGPESMYS